MSSDKQLTLSAPLETETLREEEESSEDSPGFPSHHHDRIQESHYTMEQEGLVRRAAALHPAADPEELAASSHHNSSHPRDEAEGILLEQVLFFLAGLGSSIGYIATLSSLVYFKLLFGADSFVYLNCAVFLPLLPISLAQAIWDTRFDLRYQSKVTFLVRGVLGYGFVIGGTWNMVRALSGGNHSDADSSSPSLTRVILCALQQGIGGAVLFGQLNQLASFVGSLHETAPNRHGSHASSSDETNSSNDDAAGFEEDENEALPKKFKATVSAGVQASALVVLLASVGSGFGTMNGEFFGTFFGWILFVEAVCFAASLWLLTTRRRIQVSMLRRDSSMQDLSQYGVPSDLEDFHALLSSTPSSHGFGDDDGYYTRLQSAPNILTLRELLYHSRRSCLGMALTLVPSFLVGSWFTRVQSDWMELAQVLFYTRIGSDLIGRFATILVPPPNLTCVVWTAGLRWILVVLFFANAGQKLPVQDPFLRDALSIALVATVAFGSGYLVTACYQLAPGQLPAETRAANVAKQSSLLTVAFAVSAIGGLLASFVLLAIGV